VSALDLSSTEVGYLIDRYIAKGEVSSDEGKSDGGRQSGRSQGSGVSGTGEVEEKSGMGIDEGDQTTVSEMKSMLEEKDKEIHSLRCIAVDNLIPLEFPVQTNTDRSF
jgi:hypothetical protein